MTTLHILDNSDNLDSCIQAYEPEDMVVFIGSAVLKINNSRFEGINHRYLDADLSARGLLSQVKSELVVTSDQIAEFCITYTRQVAW